MQTNYISQIISCVNHVTAGCGPILLYGENIDTGSRIAGLARGLTVNPSGRILNVGDCELAHCGVGFGIMLDGGQAVLFMKQLDFLLLGIDQIVNTYNFLRASQPLQTLGSFTIFVIVCDQGYQGPQSSLNSAGDLSSLAAIDVFCLNGASDAQSIIGTNFVRPGHRIISVSQRLFGTPAVETPARAQSIDGAVFQYGTGSDLTIACFNFSLRQGLDLTDNLARHGMTCDVFHVNYMPNGDLSLLAESCRRTGKLLIIDDTKSVVKYADKIAGELLVGQRDLFLNIQTRRGCPDFGVADEQFSLDAEAILKWLIKAPSASRSLKSA